MSRECGRPAQGDLVRSYAFLKRDVRVGVGKKRVRAKVRVRVGKRRVRAKVRVRVKSAPPG